MRKQNLFIVFLVLFFVFGVLAGDVLAKNVYTESIEKAKQAREQVETKTTSKVESEAGKEIKEKIQTVTPNINIEAVKEKVKENLQNMGEEHRSRVANTVQNLIKSAERWEEENPGIGKKVREVAKEQRQIMERTEESLEKIEKRNRILKFFVGPNYDEIEKVKEEIENYKLRIQELEEVKEQLKTEADKELIEEQIQALEEEITNLENFLKEESGRFSLFGWLFRMF